MGNELFRPVATRLHPVDLLCAYLVAGTPERMGHLLEVDKLSYGYLRQRHDRRESHGGADAIHVDLSRKVRGRRFGLSFVFYFQDGVRTGHAMKPWGATVDLAAFLRHLRGHRVPAGSREFDFDVYSCGDSCASHPGWDCGAVLFRNRREILFTVPSRTTARIEHVAGDQDLRAPTNAGGPVHPDRWSDIDEAIRARTRLLRPYLSRLRSPAPLRAARRHVPFGGR